MSDSELFSQAQDLHRRASFDQAEQLYRRLLQSAPGHGAALHGLGALLYQTDRCEEAVAVLQQAAAQAPKSALTLGLLSAALAGAGQLNEALQIAERAVLLRPDDAGMRNLAGQLAQQSGHAARALGHLREAVRAAPGEHEVQHNVAICLHTLGRLDEAIEHYRIAAQLQPGNAQPHFNLALALQATGDIDHSLGALQSCLAIDPDHVEAMYKLAHFRQIACDWDGVDQLLPALDAALRHHVASQGAALIWPYALNVLDLRVDLHDVCTEYFSAQVLTRARQMAPAFVHKPATRDKLTIGYLSADFRNHAVGGLVYQLFGEHDRDKVQVNAYSLLSADDAIAAQVQRDADLFRDLTPMSAAESAQIIRDDAPDILVDLTGYTEHARPEILALRPAPVQAQWLGYINTMQAPFIDYLLADETVITPQQTQRFSEAIIGLPGCFLPGSRLPVAQTPQRSALGLASEAFVFCSFNHTYKITRELFATWMRILQQAPDSQLWLYAGGMSAVEQRLAEQAQAAGIARDRLVFAARVPIERHMARLACADLFLDAFDYNAGATAMAAAQMGLPMLTCTGDQLRSRMTTSINRTLGLGQLNCLDRNHYEATATDLATNRVAFEAVREQASRAQGTALFSLPATARALEQAYRHMWDNYCAGNAPVSLQIPGPS